MSFVQNNFDINNQYSGKFFGQDRIGHTTPDLEASDTLRPWLAVPYPAPYLPTLRQDQGHPKLAPVVFSSQHLVGIDKSGALVPAGLFCGTQGRLGAFTLSNAVIASNVLTLTTTAAHNYVVGDSVVVVITGAQASLSGTYTITGVGSSTTFSVASTTATLSSTAVTGTSKLATQGQYCVLVYGSPDVGFAVNPQTGNKVASVGEHVVLAAPSDAVAGNITLDNGLVVTVSSGDITFAQSCTLFDGGVVKPIGVCTRNVYMYIGGIQITDTTGGITYIVKESNPVGYTIHNYIYEMGTAIQTQYVLRVPWVGATRYTISQLASADGVSNFSQGYGLTFAHFTGTPVRGAGVAAVRNGLDAGNYTAFNKAIHAADECIGHVLGVSNMINKIGFANRVRTLWDPSRLVGPMVDPNPASIMMGGSATGGLDYAISLTTDAVYKAALVQGKPVHPEYGSVVFVRVNL